MKTKLFVNFDGTIFDSGKFRDKIFEIFTKAGFSNDEIKSSYQAEYLGYKYSPWNNIKRLAKIRQFDTAMAKIRLEKIFKEIPTLIWKDSINFFEQINNADYELNLLTLGDVEFQKRKIQASGLVKQFENIYISEVQKWDYLKELVLDNERFLIIDNRTDVIEEIAKRFKKSLAIEICREGLGEAEARDTFSGIKVKNLMQALKYL